MAATSNDALTLFKHIGLDCLCNDPLPWPILFVTFDRLLEPSIATKYSLNARSYALCQLIRRGLIKEEGLFRAKYHKELLSYCMSNYRDLAQHMLLYIQSILSPWREKIVSLEGSCYLIGNVLRGSGYANMKERLSMLVYWIVAMPDKRFREQFILNASDQPITVFQFYIQQFCDTITIYATQQQKETRAKVKVLSANFMMSGITGIHLFLNQSTMDKRRGIELDRRRDPYLQKTLDQCRDCAVCVAKSPYVEDRDTIKRAMIGLYKRWKEMITDEEQLADVLALL